MIRGGGDNVTVKWVTGVGSIIFYVDVVSASGCSSFKVKSQGNRENFSASISLVTQSQNFSRISVCCGLLMSFAEMPSSSPLSIREDAARSATAADLSVVVVIQFNDKWSPNTYISSIRSYRGPLERRCDEMGLLFTKCDNCDNSLVIYLSLALVHCVLIWHQLVPDIFRIFGI